MVLTYLHILTGTIALLSGSISFAVTKGSRPHRKFGLSFVISMIFMTITGALLAFLSGERLNMVAGLVTFYLVVTAFLTVHPVKRKAKAVNLTLALLGLIFGSYAIYVGLSSLQEGISSIDGNPVQVIFVFGSISLLAVLFDFRLIAKGKLQRNSQLVRHVWRIGLAMFIATVSFFLGQSQVIPQSIRHMGLLVAPVLFVILLTMFWVIKVKVWGLKRAGITRR